jgi:hypothetical protein
VADQAIKLAKKRKKERKRKRKKEKYAPSLFI